MLHEPAEGEFHVRLNDGTAPPGIFESPKKWLEDWRANSGFELYVGDYNADGKDDVLLYDPDEGDFHVALSVAVDSFSVKGAWRTSWGATDGSQEVRVGQFSGNDGPSPPNDFYRTDIGLWEPGEADFFVSLSQGNTFDSCTQCRWREDWGCTNGCQTLHIGDFNGDDADDLLLYEVAEGEFHVSVSEGDQFDECEPNCRWMEDWGATDGSQALHIGDYDGDGNEDLMLYEVGTSQFYVSLSDGTDDFVYDGRWLNGGYATDGSQLLYIGDFNNDGADDILMYEPAEADFFFQFSDCPSSKPSPDEPVQQAATNTLLLQVRENPSRSATEFSFALPTSDMATLTIYNVAGRRVASLAGKRYIRGTHVIQWDGLDSAGARVPAGVYLARLTTTTDHKVEKFVVVR